MPCPTLTCAISRIHLCHAPPQLPCPDFISPCPAFPPTNPYHVLFSITYVAVCCFQLPAPTEAVLCALWVLASNSMQTRPLMRQLQASTDQHEPLVLGREVSNALVPSAAAGGAASCRCRSMQLPRWQQAHGQPLVPPVPLPPTSALCSAAARGLEASPPPAPSGHTTLPSRQPLRLLPLLLLLPAPGPPRWPAGPPRLPRPGR